MSEYAIEVNNLSIKFANYTVFENLSLKVPAGKCLAVIGPNGSGKSCFIKSLVGLLQLEYGSIRVNGKMPSEIPFEWIGYVPQLKTLDRTFPGRPIDLVMTGLKRHWPWHINKENKEKTMKALENVGAAHLAYRPIGKLSGGELQRVYLARCLIRNPKLILLDEPASGIDVSLTEDIYKILHEVRQKTQATVIMVTHDLAAASQHADLILLLNHEAIYFGEPQQGLTNENLHKTFGYTFCTNAMNLGG